MDWLDLLALQGTLKSLLQCHSSKASILRRSAVFTVQLSHPYMTTGKTIALTRWTFVGRAMSLLFNMLSRLVITFLPRSKCLLIPWLQSPSTVIGLDSVNSCNLAVSACWPWWRLDLSSYRDLVAEAYFPDDYISNEWLLGPWERHSYIVGEPKEQGSESSSHSPRLEKSLRGNEDPAQPWINNFFKKEEGKLSLV